VLRRHILSIVLACAALAAGIALGSGPLDDLDDLDDAGRGGDRAAITTGANPDPARITDEFARAAAQEMLPGTLSGRRVSLVALPGADDTDVTALVRHLGLAGATVSSRVSVDEQLFDPARRAYVDALATELGKRLAGRVDPAVPTYERIGQVLGATVARSSTASAAYESGEPTVAEALQKGRLASYAGGNAASASVILVVTGDPVQEAVLTQFVQGLDPVSTGVVVASRTLTGAAPEDEPVAVVRAARLGAGVATVDGIETRIGRIAATLTAVRQVTGRGGDFGASGMGGLIPRR